MLFDPEEFAARIVLGELPPEKMPAAAQDALEAGFDGPNLVRLAILDRPTRWDVVDLLPKVIAELGVQQPTEGPAAIYLAKKLGRQILESKQDPLPSLPYFYRLLCSSGYEDELTELGWLDCGYWVNVEDERTAVYEAIENLFDPVLRQQRADERQARWIAERKRLHSAWPYNLHCPSGRSEYMRRWREHWLQIPWYIPSCMGLVVLLVYLLDGWQLVVSWLVIVPLGTLTIYSVRLWRNMEYEVQARRWRERIDVD